MIAPDTPITAIRPASWRANYVLKPDMRLLATSIREYGWLYPILARREDASIIDGFHRWVAAQNDRQIRVRDNDLVPVVWVDVDQVDAVIMHLRLNRARGQLLARQVSDALQTILLSRKYSDERVADMLGMGADEFELLSDRSLLKARKIAEHKYSAAWIPIEAPRPDGSTVKGPAIERPPNADR